MISIIASALIAGTSPDPIIRRFEATTVSPLGLDVSVNGEIYISVTGTLQTLNTDREQSRQLRVGADFALEPRLSPDGQWLAYLSNASQDGLEPRSTLALWIAKTDGTAPRLLSTSITRDIAWASDSTAVFGLGMDPVSPEKLGLGSDPELRNALFVAYLNGDQRQIPLRARGGVTCCVEDEIIASTGDELVRFDLENHRVSSLFRAGDLIVRPVLSHSGQRLAFITKVGDQAVLRRRDLRTGADAYIASWPWEEVNSFERVSHQRQIGPVAALAFDGEDRVVWGAGGLIWRGDGAHTSPIPHTFSVERAGRVPVHPSPRDLLDDFQLRQLRWPTWQAGSDRLVASVAGHLWLMDGERPAERLTSTDRLEYFPSFSRDGRSLAFVSMPDNGDLELRIYDVFDRDERAVASASIIASPTFSPDGREIAFLRSSSPRNLFIEERGGQRLELVVVDLDTGRSRALRTLAWPQLPQDAHYPALSWTDDNRISVLEEVKTAPSLDDGYVLLGVDPYSGDARVIARSGRTTATAVVSPSGRLAAFYERLSIKVKDLRTAEVIAEYGPIGLQFMAWSGDNELRFTSGNVERRWRVGSDANAERRDLHVPASRERNSASVALINATVLTMGPEGVIEHGTVIWRDGRIVAVGSADKTPPPPDAEVIDVSGKFVMPGLIDVHSHWHQGPEIDLIPRQDWRHLAALAFGVTTIFDPSAQSSTVFTQAEMVETGQMMGPRIFSTGRTFPPFQASPLGFDIDTPEQMSAIVTARREQGASLVKSYRLQREQRRWLVDAASEQGLSVTTEGSGIPDDDLPDIFEDGSSSFEHSPRFGGQQDLISFAASTGMWLTPTLAVDIESTDAIASEFGALFRNDPRLDRFVPPEARRSLLANGRGPLSSDHGKAPPPQILKDLAKFVAMGGSVSVGAHMLPMQTHMELWSLGWGGMPAEDALAAATINGARKIGMGDELGTIEVGRLADLLVLNRDPRQDLRATLDATLIVSRGSVRDPYTLEQIATQPLH